MTNIAGAGVAATNVGMLDEGGVSFLTQSTQRMRSFAESFLVEGEFFNLSRAEPSHSLTVAVLILVRGCKESLADARGTHFWHRRIVVQMSGSG